MQNNVQGNMVIQLLFMNKILEVPDSNIVTIEN